MMPLFDIFFKGETYILHTIETMVTVMRHSWDDDVIAAAVLHDVVEDTSVTNKRVEKEFVHRVASLVASLSEDKKKKLLPEATWRARKWQTIFRMRNADEDTKLICLADNLSNLREMRHDYEKIGDELWARFNQKDKTMHEWYYKELLSILIKTFEPEYYEETNDFYDLIQQVFPRKRWWEEE